MKKMILAVIATVFCVVTIRACSNDDRQENAVIQPPAVIQGQQRVVVHDSDNSGFFSGLLMGHLMSSGGHSYRSHTTVVHRYSSPRYSAPKRYYGSRGFTTRSTYRSTFRSYGRR
ncbi:hypothetical protein ACIQCX_20825 [Enterobacter cancerogenus]